MSEFLSKMLHNKSNKEIFWIMHAKGIQHIGSKYMLQNDMNTRDNDTEKEKSRANCGNRVKCVW